MSELFKSRIKESAVDIVVNSIKQLLFEKKLLPGDRLPSEPEISEGLGVSRGSVREAMKILSAFGIIDIKVGNGTYITSEPNTKMIDSLLFSFFITNPDTTELTEFRKIFEYDIVELILTHYDENQTEREEIRRNFHKLQELQASQASSQELFQNDMEFHHLLGLACKNSLMCKIYDFILEFLNSSILSTYSRQKNGNAIVQTHERILSAIESKDLSDLENAINFSVNTWSNLQD